MNKLALCSLCIAAFHAAPSPAATPYAGEQTRQIKALSPDEVSGYVSGGGMGFARAAELNSYPGPMHVLELKTELGLSPDVAARLAELMAAHKAQARGLGEKVVKLEQELDTLYKERRASAPEVEALVLKIGEAQARYRAAHLSTHIATAAMLSAPQIARYNALRGYGEQGEARPGHQHAH